MFPARPWSSAKHLSKFSLHLLGKNSVPSFEGGEDFHVAAHPLCQFVQGESGLDAVDLHLLPQLLLEFSRDLKGLIHKPSISVI